VTLKDVARGTSWPQQKKDRREVHLVQCQPVSSGILHTVGDVCGIQHRNVRFPNPAVIAASYLYLLIASVTKNPPPSPRHSHDWPYVCVL